MKDEPKPSRASVLHAIIEDILARKDGKIPTNIDGMDTFFDGIDDLANALLLRWHTRLVASLERGLVDDPEDREEAVIEAWRHANWIYWGIRMVIDKLAENPPTEEVAHALRMTSRNDWAVMAIPAGLASGYRQVRNRGLREFLHLVQLPSVRPNPASPARCPSAVGAGGPLPRRSIYGQVQRCGRRSRLSTLAVHGSGLLSGGISAST